MRVSGGILNRHDATILKNFGLMDELEPWEMGLADKGYQGLHDRILTPFKTRKGEVVPSYVKYWNGVIYSARALAERANEILKRFGALSREWRDSLEMHPICFDVISNVANIILHHHPLVKAPNRYLML